MTSRTVPAQGKTIEVFLSFAAKDRAAAADLWENLQTALAASRLRSWHLWAFTEQLLLGENFDDEIQTAIADADLGIFAVSPAFLTSPYIRTRELSRFLTPAAAKRIAPVVLKGLPRDANLLGLESRQVFGYHEPYWAGRAPHARADWANRLADELQRLASRYGLGH
jgi:hypothetical protein